ncbi:MAG: glycosyltransferase family 39 protein [Verrucomicrobiota bacterium]
MSHHQRVKGPLFERIQDWIFRFDIGYGVQWFRVGLFVLVMFAVILVYTGTQFYGLRDRDVMDLGQLGRNLAVGRGYVTRNIRPVDLAYFNSIGRPALAADQSMIPELWTPPVYPMILGVMFRLVKPEVEMAAIDERLQLPGQLLPPIGDWQRSLALYEGVRGQALRMDRIVVMVAWTFYVLSMGLVYLLARELFDHRVAVMSVTLYLLCDPMLEACIAGAPTAWFALLFMITVYALVKAEQWAGTKQSIYWVTGALAVVGLVAGVGTLTRYTFACVLVPVVVYVSVSLPQVKRAVKLGAVLGMFLLVIGPWVARNLVVSRTMFGLAKLAVLEPPALEISEEKLEQQLQREVLELPDLRWRLMASRVLVNCDKLYRGALKETGANFLLAFFLASLLHRFKREDVFRLRRYLFWSLLMAVGFLAFGGVPKRNFFTMFVPVILIYGSAFFFVMFERLQFRTRWIRRGMVGLFAVLNCLPFVFTLLPPAALAPNPPYDSGVIAAVGKTFREEELIATDIPWAMAWYADRSALLMPVDEKSCLYVNDEIHAVAGIYLTQQTHMDMQLMDVVVGYQQFWLNLYQRPNPNLPLKALAPLLPRGEQVLLSGRPRWVVQ